MNEPEKCTMDMTECHDKFKALFDAIKGLVPRWMFLWLGGGIAVLMLITVAMSFNASSKVDLVRAELSGQIQMMSVTAADAHRAAADAQGAAREAKDSAGDVRLNLQTVITNQQNTDRRLTAIENHLAAGKAN